MILRALAAGLTSAGVSAGALALAIETKFANFDACFCLPGDDDGPKLLSTFVIWVLITAAPIGTLVVRARPEWKGALLIAACAGVGSLAGLLVVPGDPAGYRALLAAPAGAILALIAVRHRLTGDSVVAAAFGIAVLWFLSKSQASTPDLIPILGLFGPGFNYLPPMQTILVFGVPGVMLLGSAAGVAWWNTGHAERPSVNPLPALAGVAAMTAAYLVVGPGTGAQNLGYGFALVVLAASIGAGLIGSILALISRSWPWWVVQLALFVLLLPALWIGWLV